MSIVKFLSRKFIVLIIATILLVFKMIDQTTWLYIALAYMGTNVVAKLVKGADE